MTSELLPGKDIPERMTKVVSLVGSSEQLARVTGLSSRAIGKYRSGESLPGLGALIAIADATGVSIDWIATGDGPMMRGEATGSVVACTRPHLDTELLHLVVEAIEEGLRQVDRIMEPMAKADLVLAVYDLYTDMEQPVDKVKILKLIKSAA